MAAISMQFYADVCLPLKAHGWSVFLCRFLPVTQLVPIPISTNLDLQLSSYRSLCYNSRAHCPLLQFLHTTSAILPGAHSNFVVSSFKCDGNSCHVLIPNPLIYIRNKKGKLLPTKMKKSPKIKQKNYGNLTDKFR